MHCYVVTKLHLYLSFHFLTEDGPEQQVLSPVEYSLTAGKPLGEGYDCHHNVEEQETASGEEEFRA